MLKKCEYCGIEFEDTSRNHTKNTCCTIHRDRLWFNKDRINQLLRLRFNNLKRMGVLLSEKDKIHIKENLFPNGNCEICGETIDISRLCLDHNHKTNKFRGILCSRCNNFVGFLEKNENILSKSLNYILDKSEILS